MSPGRRPFVIVGNPGCRRVAFFQAALAARGRASATLVAYADLLTGRARLLDRLSPASIVRIESAAEDWNTYKLLLRHGATPARREGYPIVTPGEIEALSYERGWLGWPRQAYLGFRRLLGSLEDDLAATGAAVMNHPADIAMLFDKPHCQALFAQGGIPVPAALGSAPSYDLVRDYLGRMGRVMVKLAHGSGAAGCVALHQSRGRVRALTTVGQAWFEGQVRLYCQKRIRHLQDEVAITAIVDRLCVERVQVEEWLPRARIEGLGFDLRVVTMGGRPRHAVPRVSSSPFTNLNLGGRRGDLSAVRQRMGEAGWQGLCRTCREAAAVFPRSFVLGVDLLIRPDFQRHAVLEANAFGDLLPRLLDENEDTYAAELTELDQRSGLASAGMAVAS